MKYGGFGFTVGSVKVKVKLERLEKRFRKAQFQLDSDVMEDMVPYMPMQDGTFINQTKAKSAAMAGTGKVCAGISPHGRFLYEGKTMVDEKTGSTWARLGGKKVLVSQYTGKTKAKENLTYSKGAHPDAQAKWFEPAKEKHGNRWIKRVKKMAGGR